MHKIGQSRGFLGRFLGPLLKTGLPLIRNVPEPLAKSVLVPLGLTASRSGTTILIISNEVMNDVMKIIESLEESGLLIKGLSETIKNEP